MVYIFHEYILKACAAIYFKPCKCMCSGSCCWSVRPLCKIIKTLKVVINFKSRYEKLLVSLKSCFSEVILPPLHSHIFPRSVAPLALLCGAPYPSKPCSAQPAPAPYWHWAVLQVGAGWLLPCHVHCQKTSKQCHISFCGSLFSLSPKHSHYKRKILNLNQLTNERNVSAREEKKELVGHRLEI